MIKRLFFIPVLLIPFLIYGASASISIDYGSEVNSFDTKKLLGNNSGMWLDPAGYNANTAKIKAAGSTFIRFPGGSDSNMYHWNGSGAYDSNKLWHPSSSSYSPGFVVEPDYRGSSSINYGFPARLTDGDTSSASQWVSDTITASTVTTTPYVIVILAGPEIVDQFKIYWGDTYAVSYDIQYWSNTDFSWATYQGGTNYWTTLLSVTNGTGGVDTRSIYPTNAQNFRIVMKQSSGTGYKMNEIELYGAGAKRTVNANDTTQTQTIASPTNMSNHATGWIPAYDFEAFVTFLNNLGPDAQGMCTVNFGTGTYDEAAAWVQYAKDKGYLSRIKYWQIGNENAGLWEACGPVDAEYYAERFIEFSDAMKAVDPSIKICGPVLGDLETNSELYDGMSFMDKFLQVLQLHGKLASLDAVDFHLYPDWSNTVESNSLSTPNNWFGGNNYKSFIDSLMVKYYGSATAKEMILSEYNSGNATLLTMSFMNSLWITNWLGEYAKAFGPRADANIWDIMNNNASTGNYDHGFLEIGQQTGTYKYQPRASYWGMYMINNYFACADEFGNTLVSASSDQTLLPVYAAKRSDGKLSLMVVNKDPSNSYTANINISNYAAASSADLYTFAANASSPYYVQNYLWHEASPSSYADPDLPPQVNTYTTAGNSFAFNFPPYSISVFNFVPFGSVATNTPVTGPVPTFTVTPTNQPSQDILVDNCDDGDNRNNLLGYWYSYDDNGGTNAGTSYISPVSDNYSSLHGLTPQPFFMTAGGYNGTGMAARVTGFVTTAFSYGFVGFGTDIKYPSGPQPISCCNGIRFWQKGDGKAYRVKLTAPNAYPTDGAGGNMYGYQFISTSGWSQITVPFSAMSQEGAPSPWGNDHPSISTVLNGVVGIQWQTIGQPLPSIELWVDQIEIYQCTGGCIMLPTPTQTVSPTGTVTPTVTRTATATGTRTVTASITPSLTISPTFTITATGTVSRTPTLTFTATPTCTVNPRAAGTAVPGGGERKNYDRVYVYPSPLRLSSVTAGMWFLNLTGNSLIRIYDLKGELVDEKEVNDIHGAYYMPFSGIRKKYLLSPGLYVFVISNKAGQETTGKFAVVR